MQDAAPAELEYVPGSQATGAPVPLGQYSPGCAVQLMLSMPALQAVSPVLLVLWPAGQAEHEAAPP
jgi:hypothetical protein